MIKPGVKFNLVVLVCLFLHCYLLITNLLILCMEVRFQKKFQAYYKKVAGQFSLNFRFNILPLDFGNCFLCFSGLSRLALPTTGNKNTLLHKMTNIFSLFAFF